MMQSCTTCLLVDAIVSCVMLQAAIFWRMIASVGRVSPAVHNYSVEHMRQEPPTAVRTSRVQCAVLESYQAAHNGIFQKGHPINRRWHLGMACLHLTVCLCHTVFFCLVHTKNRKRSAHESRPGLKFKIILPLYPSVDPGRL